MVSTSHVHGVSIVMFIGYKHLMSTGATSGLI